MKFAIVLSLIGATAVVAQGPIQRVPLQVNNLHAQVHEGGVTGSIDFEFYDLNYNEERTSCNATWNIYDHHEVQNKCEDNDYTFNFPSGVSNIEDMTLGIQSLVYSDEQGVATLRAAAPASKWFCEKSPSTGIQDECHYEGILTIDV